MTIPFGHAADYEEKHCDIAIKKHGNIIHRRALLKKRIHPVQ